MGTKRVPINRPARMEITNEAIRLFEAMDRIECTCVPRDWDGEYWTHMPCPGCDRWWKLHSKLHRELGCKPWEWPCIQHPDTVSGYPEGSEAYKRWKPDLEAQELWQALDAAAREARRAKREAKRLARASLHLPSTEPGKTA
jgi:hypothetical protein